MKILILLVLTFSFSLYAKCPMKFEEKNICAELTWIDGPNLGTKSHFKLQFWNMDDETLSPINPSEKIKIYSWMVMDNGHSHGGAPMTWSELQTGIFEVKDARFFMGGMQGYWQVKVDLLENDETISQSAIKVEFK